MKFKIENLSPKHIEQVVAIEKECFSDPWTRGMFENELNNGRAHYTVLLDGEAVIGYTGFWKIEDEAHIMNIAVDTQYRRKHLADSLMEDMIMRAKALSIKHMTLEVRSSNSGAISLYKKYGFKETGIRKNYYEKGNEDAVIMWKECE